MTDATDADIAFLEACHARASDRIRAAKDLGLHNLSFFDFAANAAWVEVVLMAQDLLAWTRGLCLERELAKGEPKRLRYTLLHTAGRIVRHGRATTLRLPRAWPWRGHGRSPRRSGGARSADPQLSSRTLPQLSGETSPVALSSPARA
jgi:hypothetical protein